MFRSGHCFSMATHRQVRSPAVANAPLGLQQLGLRLDSDASVLHELSQRLPDGMFDGHGSVFPAPDHLVFHGLARCCMKALFKALPRDLKTVVAASLRDALFHCRLGRTRVYNARRDKVNSLQIHEWAAVLAVAPVACRRGLPATLGGRPVSLSPVGAVLAVVDALSAFASAAFFYPRVELDGAQACRRRYDRTALEEKGEHFLCAVSKMYLRPDCDGFSAILDVPNTHRFRELMLKTVHALGHIRDSLELPLEGFHQTLKRSIVRGNGHDGAARAMRRYAEQEVVSRLGSDASVFQVPQKWCTFRGVQDQINAASPLWSRDGEDRAAGSTRMSGDVWEPAQMLAASLLAQLPDSAQHWRAYCSRGSSEGVNVGDALAVLVASDKGTQVVDAAVGAAAYDNRSVVSFFRVGALLRMPCGKCAAFVSPFLQSADGDHMVLQEATCLLLVMQVGVRRAVALHACDAACKPDARGVMLHGDCNRWNLLGTQTGYPSRSA